MSYDMGINFLGLPIALWTCLLLGAAAGFMAGVGYGYRSAIQKHVMPAVQRDWSEIERLRMRIADWEDEQHEDTRSARKPRLEAVGATKHDAPLP